MAFKKKWDELSDSEKRGYIRGLRILSYLVIVIALWIIVTLIK
ncbi:hypothetical protein [Cytobacillus sp. IB215665]|nr:hypothetical protein [Cytobacillus sp. IB215665]MDX8366115.1 hypothetical protein [Cytobacillus sp. IB215665]